MSCKLHAYLKNVVRLWRTTSVTGNMRIPLRSILKCVCGGAPCIPEIKEEMGVCSRTVFGMEPSQMSFLFFLVSAAAAGGLVPMLESTSGGAQEMKIKVRRSGSLFEVAVPVLEVSPTLPFQRSRLTAPPGSTTLSCFASSLSHWTLISLLSLPKSSLIFTFFLHSCRFARVSSLFSLAESWKPTDQ